MTATHDALRAANELREQLASNERRLSFFCGAGTSMAVGLPGIQKLTEQVRGRLVGKEQEQFDLIAADLSAGANVEQILDRVRLYRELIGEDSEREYCKIKGFAEGRALDAVICRAISESVRSVSTKPGEPHLVFAQWLRALHSRRDWPIEIFTTNYDVTFEDAMETCGVPFFDGFVGSVNPFFAPECIESEGGRSDVHVYPCKAWTRLWKLHGSINWHVHTLSPDTEQITRLSALDSKAGEELAIFPARDKYSQSRKLPFLAMQDRLRKFLAGGDRLLVIVGYSFSDQHLNDLILQALRSNPHLAITALVFGEPNNDQNKPGRVLPSAIATLGREHRNLTIYGPNEASIGGIVGHWSALNREAESREWPFWNTVEQTFTLGDFNAFARFLEVFIGFSPLVASVLPQPLLVPNEQHSESAPVV
jgi:SIR2-like protein